MREECGEEGEWAPQRKPIATNPLMRPDSHTRLVTMRQDSCNRGKESVMTLEKRKGPRENERGQSTISRFRQENLHLPRACELRGQVKGNERDLRAAQTSQQ